MGTFVHMKVTSIFTAVMLLFATPVTAMSEEEMCFWVVELMELGFDHRDAGLSRREAETALKDRIAAVDVQGRTEEEIRLLAKQLAKYVALSVYTTSVFLEEHFLLSAMSDCLEND